MSAKRRHIVVFKLKIIKILNVDCAKTIKAIANFLSVFCRKEFEFSINTTGLSFDCLVLELYASKVVVRLSYYQTNTAMGPINFAPSKS